MDNDELLAVLQGHFAGINQRIDDMRVYLGSRIDDAKADLGGRIDHANKRIDTVGRFKYQGAALVVALAAAIAVIGTFALQVLAAL